MCAGHVQEQSRQYKNHSNKADQSVSHLKVAMHQELKFMNKEE